MEEGDLESSYRSTSINARAAANTLAQVPASEADALNREQRKCHSHIVFHESQ